MNVQLIDTVLRVTTTDAGHWLGTSEVDTMTLNKLISKHFMVINIFSWPTCLYLFPSFVDAVCSGLVYTCSPLHPVQKKKRRRGENINEGISL